MRTIFKMEKILIFAGQGEMIIKKVFATVFLLPAIGLFANPGVYSQSYAFTYQGVLITGFGAAGDVRVPAAFVRP